MAMGLICFFTVRPRVILTAYPSTNVHEGQLLTLTCNYTSNIKYGTIQWLKKIETSSNTSEHIESENRSISFDKVERNNMGQYICQVTNRIGTDSSKINITVSCKYTCFEICMNTIEQIMIKTTTTIVIIIQ